MFRRARHIAWFIAMTAALNSASASEYPRGELLVDAKTLGSSLDSSTIVLDVRPKDQYQAGHVTGARWVNAVDWSKGFGDGQDEKSWSQRIAELGIQAGSQVVVYDDGSVKDAARAWWILQYWGVPGAKLLDGGWTAWQAANLPQQTEEPFAVKPSDFKAFAQSERLATKNSILSSLDKADLQIVDARSEGEHCGTEPSTNKRGGAIPGAKNLEWSELLDPTSKEFKSADDLRKLFQQAGIDLEKPSAAHCQSGGRSSVMAFAMELMGAKQVGNYYKSWSEWGNADDTPIVAGKPKEK